jgi:hypothetical protein
MVSTANIQPSNLRKTVRWQGGRRTPSNVGTVQEFDTLTDPNSNLDASAGAIAVDNEEENSGEDSHESQICLAIMCLRYPSLLLHCI